MNTKLFDISKEQLKKAGIKFLLVLLAGVVTYFQTFIPGFLELVVNNEIVMVAMLGLNTALVDSLRKFLADEEGKLGGIKIN